MHGLTAKQLKILQTLGERPGSTVADVATRVGLTRTGAHLNLVVPAERGFVHCAQQTGVARFRLAGTRLPLCKKKEGGARLFLHVELEPRTKTGGT